MAPSPCLVLLVLSHLVISNSAEEKEHRLQLCPPFECGKLGEIGFPFKNITHPTCGLYTVADCTKPIQSIQLERNGKWYEVINISQGDIILIRDQELQRSLQSRNCDAFNNLTLPTSPYISSEIDPNITLFKCSHSLNITTPHTDFSYGHCGDFNIYYNRLNDSPPAFRSECPILQLPLKVPSNDTDYNDLFALVSAELKVEVQVTRLLAACGKCRLGGGYCQYDAMGNFSCLEKERGKSHLKLATGIGATAVLLICLFLFVLWRHYKQNYACSNLLSTNTSSNRSSKSDLERDSIYFGVPVYAYRELEEATNKFDPTKELGDGGFGTVYHGKLRDGREVAVKRLYEKNYERVKQFMNEVEILARLRHQNLVTLYGCTSYHCRELLLVYEFVPNGTVADHLHGDRATPTSLTWPIRLRIAIETASALAYLHASDIIHRDVKTNNILLDIEFHVKVADFGLSRLFPTDVSHISTAPQGTPGYVDPEYHQCYQLTEKSDVYSFGVVLIELISSMPAVDICRHRHEINLANLAMNRIQNGAFNELVDPCLWFESGIAVRRMTILVAELAFLCLQLERDMRPSMDEVLRVLRSIESEEHDVKKTEEADDKVEAWTSVMPPALPDPGDAMLSKNMQPPPSPDSVANKWVSRSTISTTSG